MYRVDDRVSAIKSVQRFLGATDEGRGIAVTGEYNEKTRYAIERFQGRIGLRPTGITDYFTYTALYDEYKISLEKVRQNNYSKGYITFPINESSGTVTMMHVNKMLADILDYYGIWHMLEGSSKYDSATRNAVEILSEIFKVATTQYIDEFFYSRLLSEHRYVMSAG